MESEESMTPTRIMAAGLVVAAGLTGTAIFAQQQPARAWSSGDLVYGLSLYEAGGQTADLARQYVKAEKDETKKEIRKKLSDLLSQQFDAHAEQQQKELDDLEKEIARLKSLLKKRQDAKSTIVDRRMEQLIQEAEGLGWTAPRNPVIGLGATGGLPAKNILVPDTVPAQRGR
jgi:hypothetical protein